MSRHRPASRPDDASGGPAPEAWRARAAAGEAAVALWSGGLDSGTAGALWLAAGGRIQRCVFADYGQRAAVREREFGERLAHRLELAWSAVDLSWLGEASRQSGSALIPGSARAPDEVAGDAAAPGDEASAAAVWIPARNVVLLAVGAAWAEALGATVVLAGFNREEAATFADNGPEFVAAFDQVLEHGTRTGVGVVAPTAELDKRGIVDAARGLGLGSDDFWSCYEGGPTPCGACESCLRSARGWAPGGGGAAPRTG